MEFPKIPLGRRMLIAVSLSALALGLAPARADDLSGDLAIMQWQAGVDGELWTKLEAAFMAEHPGVTVKEVAITAQGDARGGMRTALMGGEVVDIIINTWPAFRQELEASGTLRPVDDQWAAMGWDKRLGPSWRDLGSDGGKTYGVVYTYGDRSGIWYKPATLAKAGLSAPPADWAGFLASFKALSDAGVATPLAIPGKYWAHAEWFESLLARTAGVEYMAKLARHEAKWTDPEVKAALMKYGEMIQAGCCGDAAAMLANDWDGAAGNVLKAESSAYLLMGMWVNATAKGDYKLEEGKDYSFFQLPVLGMGHDDTSIVDDKELLVTANGANPAAADAFLDFITTKAAADILADYGYASPSTEADTSRLGPVQQIATKAVATSKVQFVLGDLLPGDLVDEYRVQLQKFLQDPTEATADAVLAAIEAKAATAY